MYVNRKQYIITPSIQIGMRECARVFLWFDDQHDRVPFKDIHISALPKKSVSQGRWKLFFRTISYVITGNQKNHRQMRVMVVNYLENNSKVSRMIHNNIDYGSESCMNDPGELATEVDIIATASLFATEINVFSPYGRNQKWIKYGPLRDTIRLANRLKRKMYISNIIEHFVPVLDV